MLRVIWLAWSPSALLIGPADPLRAHAVAKRRPRRKAHCRLARVEGAPSGCEGFDIGRRGRSRWRMWHGSLQASLVMSPAWGQSRCPPLFFFRWPAIM